MERDALEWRIEPHERNSAFGGAKHLDLFSDLGPHRPILGIRHVLHHREERRLELLRADLRRAGELDGRKIGSAVPHQRERHEVSLRDALIFGVHERRPTLGPELRVARVTAVELGQLLEFGAHEVVVELVNIGVDEADGVAKLEIDDRLYALLAERGVRGPERVEVAGRQ